MKSILLNIIGIAIVVSAGIAMAQYPEMTEEEIQALEGYTGMVPMPEFAENPMPCEPGDIECEALYLDVYGTHFQGFMQAQQHPSPIYSWESDQCILNSEECGGLQTQWETWVNKANTGGLDFSQGTNPSASPECIEGGNEPWFGLAPAYKCYESK